MAKAAGRIPRYVETLQSKVPIWSKCKSYLYYSVLCVKNCWFK